MTTLLFMAALVSDDWKVAVPYTEGVTVKYDLVSKIDVEGSAMEVEMLLEHKTTKKTDAGFEGSGGFAEVYVNGEMQDGMMMGVKVLANGVLKSTDSELGEGMRRMFMPFYFCFPTDAVADGGKWTFQDADAMDGHKAKFEYTLDGSEESDGKKLKRVKMVLTEEGSTPMTVNGTYWLDEKGQVTKFDLDLKGWPVPIVGQAMNATIKGKIR